MRSSRHLVFGLPPDHFQGLELHSVALIVPLLSVNVTHGSCPSMLVPSDGGDDVFCLSMSTYSSVVLLVS